MAEGGDEQPIGVAGIDGDRRDHLRVAESEVLPGPARVGGLVHPVADRKIRTDDPGARTDVDHTGI